MKHILYLAAGAGSRFGENKLLYPIAGKPLYLHALQRLESLAAARTDCTLTVITRHEEILAYAKEHGLRAVFSPESAQGMSYTVRATVQAVSPLAAEDYLVFAVADQPYLTAETVARLLDAADSCPLCGTLACGDTVGNPTLFSAALAPELCALRGDRGGRQVLRAHDSACIRIPCEAHELHDVDTVVDI